MRDAYFYFAYPFLVSVPGYGVGVRGLPDGEQQRNLQALRFISDEAAAVGLDFQLGLWTHTYKCSDSPEINYTVEGLTPERHAAYCRDALGQLLTECPSIGGVTFRVHGESGIPEGNHRFWDTVWDGISDCGRSVRIDLHAKGLPHELIDVAFGKGVPVTVSPKYWAEHLGLPYHQGSIRERERRGEQGKPRALMSLSTGSRRFTRYGYGDFLREDRSYGVLHRVWPGTQRLLLWGNPAMAAAYGRAFTFCDSLGAELFEPMSFKGRLGSGSPGGREPYADAPLNPPDGIWEKYRYTYRLWGRLLYNPDADSDQWLRHLRRRYGTAAPAAEGALTAASRILPLVTTAHLPSAANVSYWPEIYTNMPIADADQDQPYGDTPSPKRFGTVSPLDPEFFSGIREFAGELVDGVRSGKVSPPRVAQWLEWSAKEARCRLAEARRTVADKTDPAFRRLAADVEICGGLGLFFAHKLRAGLAYELYLYTGDADLLEAAVASYGAAVDAWRALSDCADGVYRDDLAFGLSANFRGHWRDRLPAIEADLAALREQLTDAPEDDNRDVREPDAAGFLDLWAPADLHYDHDPPLGFQPGEGVHIELCVEGDDVLKCTLEVSLRYRHVNQAEAYMAAGMAGKRGSRFQASIPASYTGSPYPLQYYFVLRDGPRRTWFYPGVGFPAGQQPYFVIRRHP